LVNLNTSTPYSQLKAPQTKRIQKKTLTKKQKIKKQKAVEKAMMFLDQLEEKKTKKMEKAVHIYMSYHSS